ncbi:MAG: lactate dehydrogenase [Robiginitomaculum sp.]|nr:MAG: lactate dehydrogenase [Robiginitomaculum sp.]
MNAVEIEEAISDLVIQPFDRAEFPFQFLEAFGNKETTLKRLRKGSSNRTDVDGALLQRSNIHILTTDPGGVDNGLKSLRESPKTTQQKAKFILATDGVEIQAEDLVSGEVIACKLGDLPKHFGFLLPLAGITTVAELKNNPIDIKATGRLDKLYVALLQENEDWAKQENRDDFNHFMAQLIFCFFAEDTRIFLSDNLFTATVQQMSESDGSNTQEVITNIFTAMDLDHRKGERDDVRPYADAFPYVNGGLFGAKDGKSVKVPKFSKMARTYLLRAGDLDWTSINPDIFGSMIQAVADDEERGELGMHYTSVPNILKVLNPLFLGDKKNPHEGSLYYDLQKAGNNKQQLGKLKKRIARIRVFDPACGSGNFLVIAYKRMRKIEHKANIAAGWGGMKSVIPLTNFRGIELKGFAAEIARLALIIAEYQCDELYMGQFEALSLFLPLDKTNWITRGNALRLDWLSICPPTGETKAKIWADDFFGSPLDQNEIDFANEGGETYICGNPPYLGSKFQSKEQKEDLKQIFEGRTKKWKSLDYVAGWFLKAADYLTFSDGVTAFVSTNSICQGQQVPILWPLIFGTGSKTIFAHTSFKWTNLASHNAGVTVVIIGFSSHGRKICKLYSTSEDNSVVVKEVEFINAYLVNASNIFVQKTKANAFGLPPMLSGDKMTDGGHLVFSVQQRNDLLSEYEVAHCFLSRIVGGQELIKGILRYALILSETELEVAQANATISERLKKVSEMRRNSTKISTQNLAKFPYRFDETRFEKVPKLIIAQLSSENRAYLPCDMVEENVVAMAPSLVIYDASLWNLALIASKIHLVWIATVCGKLKTDYRYSNTLGWNTFPVPKLTIRNKDDLTRTAENILLAREAHFPATIADLYKPDAMPENLRAAHAENDRILEEIYIGRRFKNDTERLEKLFEMYTEMTTKVKPA